MEIFEKFLQFLNQNAGIIAVCSALFTFYQAKENRNMRIIDEIESKRNNHIEIEVLPIEHFEYDGVLKIKNISPSRIIFLQKVEYKGGDFPLKNIAIAPREEKTLIWSDSIEVSIWDILEIVFFDEREKIFSKKYKVPNIYTSELWEFYRTKERF